ncbi:MAG: hypothetical protein A2201_04605 [Alicyclobacillus sp. RIFOXYA1_FULL_53_8]|nr:MAG: hypothetical protein A2201_04605 [Alicyclobacillus sp. RIFOXYA1_FULL_53_8]
MTTAISRLNRRVLVPVGVLALMAALSLTLPVKGLARNLQSHNLFALIGDLGGTTGSMLKNTEILHNKVVFVQGELGQLKTQESVLKQQMVTGSQLSQQLSTQEKLTRTDVQLMQQILARQQQSVALTGQVATQASALSTSVTQNVQQLARLSGSLNTASIESNTLNQQMDQLLSQLDQATQEFRLFGQVDKLLSSTSGLLPRNPLGSSSLSSLLPTSSLLPSQGPLGGLGLLP